MTTLYETKWWDLARLAGTAHPDSTGSPGADFLVSVRDRVAEAWDLGDDLSPDSDLVSEIADSAVPAYTVDRWRAYCDLCAWNEDLSDLAGDGRFTGDWSTRMTDLAGLALYLIAERLVRALAEKLAEDQTP